MIKLTHQALRHSTPAQRYFLEQFNLNDRDDEENENLHLFASHVFPFCALYEELWKQKNQVLTRHTPYITLEMSSPCN